MQTRLENIKIVTIKARIMIFKKHGCQKAVAMATANLFGHKTLMPKCFQLNFRKSDKI